MSSQTASSEPVSRRAKWSETSSRRSFRLSEFRGESAQIVALDLPEAESKRLKCMGLFIGQSIRLQKTGSPMILTAAGSRVAIAQEIARRIMVQANVDQPRDDKAIDDRAA